MKADEIVERVHRRDALLREASALAQLSKDVTAGNEEFGHQSRFGSYNDKVFRALGHSQQKRLAELAAQHAGELRAEAERIMTELEVPRAED